MKPKQSLFHIATPTLASGAAVAGDVADADEYRDGKFSADEFIKAVPIKRSKVPH